VNYITVQGFTMKHAATQWAPPTAEQTGLIGTHWSKGWIIEDNDISYSVCTGITLGKYGDEYDNKSANSAEGYVATINRALKNGWNMETVGSHIVRNNTISHCEQAGLVGSMGAIFSTVTGNTIHDIHQRKLFSGAEMAGIKFHGAIDAIIEHNHIYQTSLGLWLDWMAQGTRVSCNLFHDNQQDVFLEVNHGPYVLDNNIFLSSGTVSTLSRGGAYVHNLFTGNISIAGYDSRLTPFHPAHSTKVAGLHDNPRGDERYYNNIFVNSRGLAGHNEGVNPVFMGGNVFLGKSEACIHEESPLVLDNFDPEIKLVEKEDGYYLEFTFDSDWIEKQKRDLITSDLLGKAKIPDLPYENRDGSQVRVDTDYSGKQRNKDNPFPGPFVVTQNGKQMVKVWPVSRVNKP